MTDATQGMPEFIFVRRRQIEAEEGCAVAGELLTSFPKGRRLNKRQKRYLIKAIEFVCRRVREGGLGDGEALGFGWGPGERPPSLSIEDLDRWADTHIVVLVTSGAKPEILH